MTTDETESDFTLAASFAEQALTCDPEWARFFHGMARFWWARALGEM